MKQTLTTTAVAKLLGLHANTVKNWVRDGKLPSFRTIGGHYRVGVDELVSALKEKGIPVPEALLSANKTDIYIVHSQEEVRGAIEKDVNTFGIVNVMSFDCGVDALMAMGRCMPTVIIWDASQKDVKATSVLRSLRGKELEHRVDMALVGDGDSLMNAGLPDELTEIPMFIYPESIPEMLKWMRRVID